MRSRVRPVPRSLIALAAFAAFASFTASPTARAEDEWRWPEKPKNLQVLPKEFTGRKLSPLMRGFTRALGVRCSYCHTGEEGKPLSTYDFASDANPNKERARAMYRMLGSINDQLRKIEPSHAKRVNMWCHTCHQGKPRPATLEEELDEAYGKAGITAALARYRELRERFHGRSAYDFGERSLNDFGYTLLERGDHAGATAVFRLNTTEFPQSGGAWDSLGESYLKAGNTLLAGICYRKALELDPKNDNAVEKLHEMETMPAK